MEKMGKWNANIECSKELQHVNNDQKPQRSAVMCSLSAWNCGREIQSSRGRAMKCSIVVRGRGKRFSPKAPLLPAWRHSGVKGRRRTDLLAEAPCPQEKSQKTPNDHSQHRHDEEPILFAHVLHPHPHCVQSHGHRESPVLSATHKCAHPKA